MLSRGLYEWRSVLDNEILGKLEGFIPKNEKFKHQLDRISRFIRQLDGWKYFCNALDKEAIYLYYFLMIIRNGPFLRHSRDNLLCKKFVIWFMKTSKTNITHIWKILVILTPYSTYIFLPTIIINILFLQRKMK